MALLSHPLRHSPDSLKKTLDFETFGVRRNCLNVVKRCLQQILNCLDLVINSANITHDRV